MKSKLVNLYNQELAGLRQRGEQFANAYPKIASRLKLGQGNFEDPTVGRLLESFAFLTSHVRYDLETESAQLTKNMLQLLYPHYFLPVPACSTVQLTPDEKLESGYTIPAKTVLSTPLSGSDEACFSTSYPVNVLPVHLSALVYEKLSSMDIHRQYKKPVRSSLTMTVEHLSSGQSLADLAFDSLRLFVDLSSVEASQFLQLMQRQCVHIALIDEQGEERQSLSTSMICPVGFEADDALLPYPTNSFDGYRLLTEYFAYPEKFHYIDLTGFTPSILEDLGSAMSIRFYFEDVYEPLLQREGNDWLKLHCTPIVNLFEQVAEPIQFDHTKREYQVVANAQMAQQNIEVYRIQSIEMSSSQYVDSVEIAPYFGRQFSQNSSQYLYWHSVRHSCESLGEYQVPGDEVFVNFSDFELPGIRDRFLLTPTVLCTNRAAPEYLPYGGGQPYWKFRDVAHDLIEGVQCIRPITATYYRDRTQQERADLAEHVAINQIGLSDPEQSLANLKQMLSIYGFANQFSSEFIERGLIRVDTKTVTRRFPNALRHSFCRGIDYQLTVDEDYLGEHELFVFGSVLQRFLTKSCALNSFVELRIHSKQNGEMLTWQPMLGNKPIL